MKVKLQSIAKQKNESTLMEELSAGEVTEGLGIQCDEFDVCAAGRVVVLSKESWIKLSHEAEIDRPWLAHDDVEING
ncbi:MAG: hypothetical protein ACO2YY_07080 [Pseudohongiellaceae bacterium]